MQNPELKSLGFCYYVITFYMFHLAEANLYR